MNMPPLGVEPKFIWLEHRMDEILAAMGRYREAGLRCPNDWYDELIVILTELRHR